ncbi:hypothetical protein [Campylobacter sp. CCUG 57310]|uniref:hypothetical protein n=1 Tax=Campylobacter sp. CCUG 57310 TaxID=2517362 RepID=UPI001563FEE8|nr:hypothetical protein [Campylobacter sp. CCUG 57310]QKF93162.1 hypothetical protein CORI_2015 [Campylobacter sp. CCUG 57310]
MRKLLSIVALCLLVTGTTLIAKQKQIKPVSDCERIMCENYCTDIGVDPPNMRGCVEDCLARSLSAKDECGRF